jgi:hypothetical protein
MSSANSRFRVTLWPTTPLAPRPVLRNKVVVSTEGMLVWGAHLDAQELPAEWVLRQLGDADLDDDMVVTTLLNEYGKIRGPYIVPGWLPDDARAKVGYDRDEYEWWDPEDGTTIEDARWYLKSARVLAVIWARATRDEDPVTAWADEGFNDDVVDGYDPEALHWTAFATLLNDGLAPYGAHVEAGLVGGGGAVGLYSAACLQVFNLMVEGQTARRCENEPCGQIFVHQLGRAEHRQHWNNPRYCTKECAHAEASRQYRRRKAARKEQP